MRIERKIRGILDACLSTLCVGIFILLVAIGTYQIVVRYLFNSPSTVSEELLTYGFTWMALFAAAYVFGKREHMRMGFLADKIGGNARRILEIVIELVVFAFAVIVMVYGGYEIVGLTMSQKTASLGISMGSVYVVVLISGVVTCIYGILNMIELCFLKKNDGSAYAFDVRQLRSKQLSEEIIDKGRNMLEETEGQ